MQVDPTWYSGLPQSVLANVIANSIWLILGIVFIFFRTRLQRLRRAVRPALLGLMALSYVSANLFNHSHPFVPHIGFFLVSSMIIGIVVWHELYQFWRIGLVGADKTIDSGLDFKRSLNLCTNSLDFLGVSGSKLTTVKPDFEEAIGRCHRDTRPIRFLLCNPKSADLIRIAKRAAKPDAQYQETARKSLRVLADLRNNRQWNIKVRFYRSLPLFRLMFIDDALCLASHYVFGEGEGGQLPQLHVRKPTTRQRDVETLYYPFRKYFDQTWEEAEEWDFKSGLES